jgi:acyl-CoA oxidase
MKTHKNLPGIETGDIGPKFGYHSKDNGYMVMKNIRIPRDQLLSRYVGIDREGNYEIKGDLRVLYGVMMFIRVQIIIYSGYNLY